MLNSFAKSYIIDRAARRALSVSGVRGVLVDAGGDVVTRGAWTQTIGVADPVASADNLAPRERLTIRDARLHQVAPRPDEVVLAFRPANPHRH